MTPGNNVWQLGVISLLFGGGLQVGLVKLLVYGRDSSPSRRRQRNSNWITDCVSSLGNEEQLPVE